MLYAVLSKTQNTLKCHLATVKPSFNVKTINCLYQTGPTGRKLEMLGMSLICFVSMPVTDRVSVMCQKLELFFTKPGVKTNRQYCLDILCVTDGNFIFQQYSALMPIAFNTVQLLQCKTPIFLSFWLRPQNSVEL